ncbi:TIR domain-containing protein [Ferribacterium limneticum]|uniref:TIR domain-containing protein n=1 Tax=Ferribacterium limneticum TaxID=76259 RepID=UPI001CF7FD7E|nr:TIR domain-containing protein [Ferribacterium limneticum]UCV21453.1 TIR domain-containing protein [Ferribacterium limneticum]
MADIFISYSREDEARIMPLVSAFEAQGWSVFWDRRIPTGETWRTYIGSALRDARCIVVVWSKDSVESQWVAEEADDGRVRKILLPVMLDPVQPPRGFREIQAADISDWPGDAHSRSFAALLADLHRMLGTKPAAVPEAPPPQPAVVREHPGETPLVGHPGRRTAWLALPVLLGLGAAAYFLAGGTDDKVVDPPPVQVRPDTPRNTVNPAGAWFVVAGSFSRAEQRAAERQRIQLDRAGFNAAIIDSSDYPLLTQNLWVVGMGPFASKERANAVLARLQASVPDAYVKKGR